jgi:hypothetical protein
VPVSGEPPRSLGRVGVALLAMLLGPLAPAPASAQQPQPAPEPPSDDPFERPTPHDPDDAPFTRAPRNQLGQWTAGRRHPLVRGFDDDHWVALTLVPTYAAMRLPFIGRGNGPYRGGGIGLELDVRIVRWLFVRVYGSHTIHPVPRVEVYDENLDEVGLLANAGTLQATDTGLSIVYALDIGRFVPRVDVGAGLLFVRSPPAAQPGQWGAECRTGNVCDLGLRCSAEQTCQPAPFPEVHAGIALDVLLGRRWSVGVGVRYHALIQAISQFPMYATGHVRLAVRF